LLIPFTSLEATPSSTQAVYTTRRALILFELAKTGDTALPEKSLMKED
jgi:hypothetical protein